METTAINVEAALRNSSYQKRVGVWMRDTFCEELVMSPVERRRRLIEETLELAQSLGGDEEEVLNIARYVHSRPIGEPKQEVGGNIVTLACLCESMGIDMMHEGEVELERIWQNQDKIRAKNAAKPSDIAVKPNSK